MALRKIPVFVRDGESFYKYATIDWLDSGNGVMVHNQASGEKLSRHSNGNTFARVPGSPGGTRSTSVPFSDIEHEIVTQVPIPSSFTWGRRPWTKALPGGAVTFSSTVLESRGTFVAEVAAEHRLAGVVAAYEHHPCFLSAQTHHDNGLGKTLVVSILNARST